MLLSCQTLDVLYAFYIFFGTNLLTQCQVPVPVFSVFLTLFRGEYCHAQDATLSSIWHEGLVMDRSASRRFARMDIVTSTCTEKMRYMELAYTRHKLHQSHISTLHNHQE